MRLSKNKKIIILIVIALVTLSYPISYVIILKSDAYKTSREFLTRDSVVHAQLGSEIDISPAFFGASIKHSDGHWTSHMKIYLKGDRAKATAQIELEDKDGTGWNIREARLVTDSGELIDLLPSK